MTQRIPGVLETAESIACEKGIKIRELQSSAEVLVEVLLNAGPAELKTGLQVVFADFPGQIFNELVIAVLTRSGVAGCGTGLREEAASSTRCNRDEQNGQARVVQTTPRTVSRQAGGAEAVRTRMEILVLREKTLREPIPTIAQLIHHPGADRMYIGDRNQLHSGWRDRIEAGKLPSGSSQGQGKRLRAVPKEIAPRKNIVLIETVVDLANHAAEVVGGGSSERGIWTIRTTCVGRVDAGNIRRRPWIMLRNQICDDWVARIIRTQGAARTRALRHAGESYRAHGLTLPLIVEEEECLVLHNRTAERTAELVIVEGRAALTGEI